MMASRISNERFVLVCARRARVHPGGGRLVPARFDQPCLRMLAARESARLDFAHLSTCHVSRGWRRGSVRGHEADAPRKRFAATTDTLALLRPASCSRTTEEDA